MASICESVCNELLLESLAVDSGDETRDDSVPSQEEDCSSSSSMRLRRSQPIEEFPFETVDSEIVARKKPFSFGTRRRLRQARHKAAEVRKSNGLDLWEACISGDLLYVQQTIKIFPNLIHLEQQGRTPLYLACKAGHGKIAELLLHSGAMDVDGTVFASSQHPECRALLQQYKIIEDTLNGTSSVCASSNGDDSSNTPRIQNLSSCLALRGDRSLEQNQSFGIKSVASMSVVNSLITEPSPERKSTPIAKLVDESPPFRSFAEKETPTKELEKEGETREEEELVMRLHPPQIEKCRETIEYAEIDFISARKRSKSFSVRAPSLVLHGHAGKGIAWARPLKRCHSFANTKAMGAAASTIPAKSARRALFENSDRSLPIPDRVSNDNTDATSQPSPDRVSNDNTDTSSPPSPPREEEYSSEGEEEDDDEYSSEGDDEQGDDEEIVPYISRTCAASGQDECAETIEYAESDFLTTRKRSSSFAVQASSLLPSRKTKAYLWDRGSRLRLKRSGSFATNKPNPRSVSSRAAESPARRRIESMLKRGENSGPSRAAESPTRRRIESMFKKGENSGPSRAAESPTRRRIESMLKKGEHSKPPQSALEKRVAAIINDEEYSISTNEPPSAEDVVDSSEEDYSTEDDEQYDKSSGDEEDEIKIVPENPRNPTESNEENVDETIEYAESDYITTRKRSASFASQASSLLRSQTAKSNTWKRSLQRENTKTTAPLNDEDDVSDMSPLQLKLLGFAGLDPPKGENADEPVEVPEAVEYCLSRTAPLSKQFDSSTSWSRGEFGSKNRTGSGSSESVKLSYLGSDELITGPPLPVVVVEEHMLTKENLGAEIPVAQHGVVSETNAESLEVKIEDYERIAASEDKSHSPTRLALLKARSLLPGGLASFATKHGLQDEVRAPLGEKDCSDEKEPVTPPRTRRNARKLFPRALSRLSSKRKEPVEVSGSDLRVDIGTSEETHMKASLVEKDFDDETDETSYSSNSRSTDSDSSENSDERCLLPEEDKDYCCLF